MARSRNRDDFSAEVRFALARRAGFLCSICRAVTVGPSAESAISVTNVGIAAHITAAAPGGKRYCAALTPEQRQAINNGIWLCVVHAKAIDDDAATWTESKLRLAKKEHEDYIAKHVGVPERHRIVNPGVGGGPTGIQPREYAFAPVGLLMEPYKTVIRPILEDKGLKDDAVLGLLMCGSPPFKEKGPDYQTPWTRQVSLCVRRSHELTPTMMGGTL